MPGDKLVEVSRDEWGGTLFASAIIRYFRECPPEGEAAESFEIVRHYVRLREIPTLLEGYRVDRMIVEEDSILPVGTRVTSETLLTPLPLTLCAQ